MYVFLKELSKVMGSCALTVRGACPGFLALVWSFSSSLELSVGITANHHSSPFFSISRACRQLNVSRVSTKVPVCNLK